MEPEELWNLACLEWENLLLSLLETGVTRFQVELPPGLMCQRSAVQGYIR